MGDGQTVNVHRRGKLVVCEGSAAFGSNVDSLAGQGNEKLPEGYRPISGNAIIQYSSNDPSMNGAVLLYPDGSLKLYGKIAQNRFALFFGTWFTDDDWPE